MALFSGAEPMMNFKIEEDDGDGRPNPYPQRPGESDCKYYLRTGFCSYGSNCKYNHPTSTEQVIAMSDAALLLISDQNLSYQSIVS